MIRGGLMQDLLDSWGKSSLSGKSPITTVPEDSIAGIAKARGQDVMEVMYDPVDNDGKELFYQPLGGYQGFSLEGQKKLLEHPNVLFGLSDGGAHCGVIADAGMPTFIMTHWAVIEPGVTL